MRVAREGIPFVLGFLVAGGTTSLALAIPIGAGGAASLLIPSPLYGLALFSLWFFRDPEREVPAGPGVVVSPADGKVVALTEDAEGPSIAIFLSVFDVHVNRAPIAGRVETVAYRPGSFRAAFDEAAGEINERNEIVIAGETGRVRVRQIAGLIARRIVCRVAVGDRLEAGQRFGMIRFGSRTDLRLPPGSAVQVGLGDRVRGGESVVGRLASAAERAGSTAGVAPSPGSSESGAEAGGLAADERGVPAASALRERRLT